MGLIALRREADEDKAGSGSGDQTAATASSFRLVQVGAERGNPNRRRRHMTQTMAAVVPFLALTPWVLYVAITAVARVSGLA